MALLALSDRQRGELEDIVSHTPGAKERCRAQALLWIADGSAAAGDRPLELTARVSPSGRWTRAKRSPPTPHMCGYATARTVAARSAAG